MAQVINLEIDQGATFVKKFLIRNQDNSSPDITGWSARMQFRTHVSSTDTELEADTTNSKLVLSASDTSISISLSATDTSSLNYSSYVYDLEIVKTDNSVIRLVQGKVLVNNEVTR